MHDRGGLGRALLAGRLDEQWGELSGAGGRQARLSMPCISRCAFSLPGYKCGSALYPEAKRGGDVTVPLAF